MSDSPLRSIQDQLNLRELEIFVTVCETGSISAAARREGITQSAASQMVQRLEQRMQMTLLDRSIRPLRLTADGNDVLVRARKLIDEARQFINRYEGAPGQRPLDLRIGVVETLSLPFIPRLVHALGPRLSHLSVIVGSSNEQKAAFLERRLDVMIMSDPMDDLPDIETHVIAEEPFILLVPSGYAVHDVAGLRTLAAELPMIRFGYRSAARSNIDAQLKRLRVNIQRNYEMDTPDTVAGMVAAGLGWAIITPLSLRAVWHETDSIEILRFPGAQFQRRLYLASRQHELGSLPEELASLTRSIVRNHYLPRILAKEAWLASAVLIPH